MTKVELSLVDKILLVITIVGSLSVAYCLHNDGALRHYLHLEETGSVPVGHFEEANNDVRRRLAHSLSWYAINTKEEIFADDHIFTGQNSQAKLALKNGVSLDLGPNTMVVLQRVHNELLLNLQLGQVRAQIKGHHALKVMQHGKIASIASTQSESSLNLTRTTDEGLQIQPEKGHIDVDINHHKQQINGHEKLKIDQDLHLTKATPLIDLIQPQVEDVVWLDKDHNDVEFRWQNLQKAAPQEAPLELEVAKDPNFEKVVAKKTIEDGPSEKASVPIADAGYFYWKMAQDGKDVSPVVGFEVARKVPPGPLFPVEGVTLSLTQPNRLEFKWSDKAAIEKYHLQIAHDPDFKDMVVDTNVGQVTSVQTLPAARYYWRVAASDGPTTGLWSRTVAFGENPPAPVVATAPPKEAVATANPVVNNPEAASLLKPDTASAPAKPEAALKLAPPKITDKKIIQLINADSTRNPSSVQSLKWQPVSGAQGYEVVVSADKSFKDAVTKKNSSNQELDWRAKTPGLYYWKVRSLAGDQKSEFSSVGRIIAGVTPPRTKSHIEKVMNVTKPDALKKPMKVTVEWKPVPFATAYKLKVSADRHFKHGVHEIKTKSPHVSVPVAGSKIYYKVAALDKHRQISPYSQTSDLHVVRSLDLNPPALSLPADGMTSVVIAGNGQNPLIFAWGAVAEAQGYRFELAADPQFHKIVFHQQVKNATQIVYSKPVTAPNLYWRVQAYYEKFSSPWSSARVLHFQSIK